MKRISLMTLAVALWGCGGTDNPGDGNNPGDGGTDNPGDGATSAYAGSTTDGSAYLVPSMSDGSSWAVSANGPELVTGMTGSELTLPADDDGVSYTVEFGSGLGCDGQVIQGDQMALSADIVVKNGEKVPVTASPFDYYEWDGRLDCTATWNDGEQEYDPNDFTNEDEGTTCIDHNGELEIGGQTLSLASGAPVMDDGEGTVRDFSITSEGLSLTWDVTPTFYIDCVVVD